MTLSKLTRRAIATIAALSLAFSAFAISLPKGAQLRLHNEAGVLVGGGKVDDDRELEFDVLDGQAGFATLTVRLPGGAEEVYEVLYGERGQVLVVVGQEIVPLRDLARSAGLEYDFDVEDRDDWFEDCDEDDDRWDDDWDDDWDDCDDDDDRDDRRDDDRRDRRDRDDDGRDGRDDRDRDERNRDDGDRRDRDDSRHDDDDDDRWDDDDDDDRWDDDDDDDDDRWDDDDDDGDDWDD